MRDYKKRVEALELALPRKPREIKQIIIDGGPTEAQTKQIEAWHAAGFGIIEIEIVDPANCD